MFNNMEVLSEYPILTIFVSPQYLKVFRILLKSFDLFSLSVFTEKVMVESLSKEKELISFALGTCVVSTSNTSFINIFVLFPIYKI